jgi:zinc protease
VPAEKQTLQVADKANAMFVAVLPMQMKDTDADYPAMTMANYMFGESGLNARLFARIRGKEGLSYGAYSQFYGTPTDDNQLLLAVAICAPENAPKVEASFKDEVRKIGAEGFTAKELEDAKKSWLQQNQISRANDQELVRSLASDRFYGRTMAFDAEMEAKVQKLSVEQVNLAFKKYVSATPFSLYRAGDFAKVKATFE